MRTEHISEIVTTQAAICARIPSVDDYLDGKRPFRADVHHRLRVVGHSYTAVNARPDGVQFHADHRLLR